MVDGLGVTKFCGERLAKKKTLFVFSQMLSTCLTIFNNQVCILVVLHCVDSPSQGNILTAYTHSASLNILGEHGIIPGQQWLSTISSRGIGNGQQ